MRLNILLVILSACIILAGVLMLSQVEGQKKDIRALTDRVESLETITYHQQRTQNASLTPVM